MEFFTDIFIVVDAALESFYAANIQNVMNYVAPSISIFAIILCVGLGISLMNGWIQQSAKPLLLGAATVTLISLLSTNIGIYNTYIADFLRNMPDEFIALISDGADGVGGALDSFGDDVLGGINTMWKNASGIGETAAVAVVCIAFFLAWVFMSVAAAFALLMAKIVLTILVVAGPLFVLFLMFPQTKEYFTKWFTYCLSFSMLALIVGGIIAITADIASGYFEQFNENSTKIDFVAFAAPMVIIYGLYRLFDNAPSLASSLSGGIGLSVGNGIAGVANRATAPLRQGGSAAASYAGKKAADVAEKKGYQKTANALDPERRQAKKSVRMHEKTLHVRQQKREARQAQLEAEKQQAEKTEQTKKSL